MSKKIRFISLIVLVLLLSSTLASVSAQGGDGDEVRLVMEADTGVILHGEDGEWDGMFTVPSVVLEIDGTLHMLRNGYPNWPAPNSVGYLTSEDGINWTEVQEEPVFHHDEAPFGADMNLLTSAFVEDDGTWVFYFFLFSEGDPTSGIARATAPSPTDPWVFDEQLVLVSGSEDAWDAGGIGSTEVFKLDNGYLMYYVAEAGYEGYNRVGMATSADGINWVKYDDPNTTEPPYHESDPVFLPQDATSWEFDNITDLGIIPYQDGWMMLYGSMDNVSGRSFSGYNLAFSDDGINWERLSDDPLWTGREIRRRPTWTFELIEFEDEYVVWMEISRAYRGDTDIFIGKLEGLN